MSEQHDPNLVAYTVERKEVKIIKYTVYATNADDAIANSIIMHKHVAEKAQYLTHVSYEVLSPKYQTSESKSE